jgi:hypothetical protein
MSAVAGKKESRRRRVGADGGCGSWRAGPNAGPAAATSG